jgi:hypothetical protein
MKKMVKSYDTVTSSKGANSMRNITVQKSRNLCVAVVNIKKCYKPSICATFWIQDFQYK